MRGHGLACARRRLLCDLQSVVSRMKLHTAGIGDWSRSENSGISRSDAARLYSKKILLIFNLKYFSRLGDPSYFFIKVFEPDALRKIDYGFILQKTWNKGDNEFKLFLIILFRII